MALTEARKGELALLYLKQKLREDSVRLTPDIRRRIGNTAKTLGIPYAEAFEFVETLTRELVEETFRGGPGKEPAKKARRSKQARH